MKNILILSACCLTAAASSQTVWYGGDFDGRDGLHSVQGAGFDSMVYDDFTLASATTITGVFANFLDAGAVFTTAAWEVRSGVSAGNGGTLVAGGTGAPVTVTPTGRAGFGLNENQVMISGLNSNLAAGTYHLGISVEVLVAGSAYISTTSGTDEGPGGDPNPAVTGSPIANGNSYFNSPVSFLAIFEPTGTFHGAGTWDYSMGVNGVVPEPATFVVLGTALFGLAAMRRRRS